MLSNKPALSYFNVVDEEQPSVRSMYEDTERPPTCSLLKSRESYSDIRARYGYDINFFSSNLQLVAVANVVSR